MSEFMKTKVTENRSGSPNQIAILSAIVKELAKQGFPFANQRQMNTLIQASNLVVDQFARPHQPATANIGLRAWLASDDTGSSSREMASHLGHIAGMPEYVDNPGDVVDCKRVPNHPSDPADLGRCIRLLDAVPEFRPLLPRMAEVSPTWGSLAGAWEELEGLYREELPTGQAPKCYARMKEVMRRNAEHA